MKKKFSIGKRMLAFVLTFAMVFTAISWGEVGSVKAAEEETNLLPSGSCDDKSTLDSEWQISFDKDVQWKDVMGWSTQASSEAWPVGVKSGTGSWNIGVTTGANLYIGTKKDVTGLETGKKYLFSGYVRVIDDPKTDTYVNGSQVKVEDGWTQFSVEYTAKASDNYPFVKIWAPSGTSFCLDELSLTLASGPVHSMTVTANDANGNAYVATSDAQYDAVFTVPKNMEVTISASTFIDQVQTAGLGEGEHIYWWAEGENKSSALVKIASESLDTIVQCTATGDFEIDFSWQDSSYKHLYDGKVKLVVEDSDIPETTDEIDTSTEITGTLDINKISNLDSSYIMGMDISSMISEIQSGVVYKDYAGNPLYTYDGTEASLSTALKNTCQFLAGNGVTDIRIRVWNNPYTKNGNGYGGGNNDVAKAKLFADAARETGLKMMVDFHCSDFWCDPGKQSAPKVWSGSALEVKQSNLTTFIADALNTIDNSKNVVTKVQVGNETNNGFVGENTEEAMCALYKTGITAVKAYNSNVQTVIHLTNPEKGNMLKWAKILNENSVPYDILATSYYPYWHGSLDNLKYQFKLVKAKYGKDCMVAETSYANTLADTDGHENTVRAGNNDSGDDLKWAFTIQGQATYMREVMNTVNQAGGLGVFYWESAWITVGDTTGLSGTELENKKNANELLWEQYGSGWASSYSAEYDSEDAGKWHGGSAVDNQAFFAADGTALASLNVFEYVKTGAASGNISVESIENPTVSYYLGEKVQLPSTVEVAFNTKTIDKAVTWSSTPSTNRVGTYTVTGTIPLAANEIPTTGTYAGQKSLATTFTCVVKHVNILPNKVADFSDPSVFEFSETENSMLRCADSQDEIEAGNPVLHWWLEDNREEYLTTKDSISLNTGTYTLQADIQGYASDAVKVQVLDAETEEVIGESDYVNCNGYINYKYPSTMIILSENKNVKVRVYVKCEGYGVSTGGWGTVDNLYLYDVNATEYVAPTPGSGANNNYTGDYSGATGAASDSSAKTDDTTVTKNEDGTTTETKTETTTNESGKEVETTVTTTKDADGKVTGSTEVSTIANVAKNTDVTVTVEKDADGKVAEAAAEVTKKGATTKTGTKGTIAGVVVDQIKEAAGTADIAITTSVTDAKGKEKYSVTVNASDLVAGEKLTVVVKDEKTGKTVLVDAKQVKVTVNGGVNVVLPEGKDYTLIDTKEAEKVTKEILKTVAPVKTSATLKEGKKATAKLSKKLDMDNVKKITYVSSKKSVATVDQNGKVTAKKAGTVIISIKVTLNNGTTKTVKMKYKVK